MIATVDIATHSLDDSFLAEMFAIAALCSYFGRRWLAASGRTRSMAAMNAGLATMHAHAARE